MPGYGPRSGHSPACTQVWQITGGWAGGLVRLCQLCAPIGPRIVSKPGKNLTSGGVALTIEAIRLYPIPLNSHWLGLLPWLTICQGIRLGVLNAVGEQPRHHYGTLNVPQQR